MAVITIKGRDYTPVIVKDSFDRRAQQFRNAIVAKLRKIGVLENDVDIELENAAFRKVPASVTWWMNGQRLYYSCAVMNSYASNLNMVSRVIDAEVQALLDEKQPLQDFISKFTEDKDVEEDRKKARTELGLHEDEKDIDVINRTYKELAKVHHPDRHGGNDSEFKRINNAHKTLKRELS